MGRVQAGLTPTWDLPYVPSATHIVAVYDAADSDTRRAGLDWYSTAHRVACELAIGHPNGLHKAAGVLAAYSPRSNWSVNVRNAELAMRNRQAHGGAGTGAMTSHARLAQRIIDGESYETVLRGEKSRTFARLIETGGSGCDDSCVVIDRHAVSIAVGRRLRALDIDEGSWHSVWELSNRGLFLYRCVADAYADAARVVADRDRVTIASYQIQAVTWIQFRSELGISAVSSQTNGAGYLRRGSRSLENRRQVRLFDVFEM